MTNNPVPTDKLCPRCGESIAAAEQAGRDFCGACGAQFADRPDQEWENLGLKGMAGNEGFIPKNSRRQLQICFWTLFVIGPLSIPVVIFGSEWLSARFSLAFLDVVPVWCRVLITFCLCHIGAAFCLGRLRATECFDVVGDTILYYCLLLVAYVCLSFIFFSVLTLVTVMFR